MARGEDTKAQILEAALALYAETGFRGTGLTAIGERAGVTHAAVLYHYGTARDLLLAVLEERQRRVLDELGPAWSGTPTEVIENLPATARHNVAKPGLARLYTVVQAENLDADGPFHDFFLANRRRTHAALCDVLRRGMASGEFRAGLPVEQIASEVMVFIAGAEVHQFLDPEQVDLVALYEGYAAALLERLRPPA